MDSMAQFKMLVLGSNTRSKELLQHALAVCSVIRIAEDLGSVKKACCGASHCTLIQSVPLCHSAHDGRAEVEWEPFEGLQAGAQL